ncbi:hypothetical protein D3C81_1648390 [compost metagenome]
MRWEANTLSRQGREPRERLSRTCANSPSQRNQLATSFGLLVGVRRNAPAPEGTQKPWRRMLCSWVESRSMGRSAGHRSSLTSRLKKGSSALRCTPLSTSSASGCRKPLCSTAFFSSLINKLGS